MPAYGFQLLVIFTARQLKKTPSQLEVEDIGVPMTLSFLDLIEQDRDNTARSRNARLAAIKSFFRFHESCTGSSRSVASRPRNPKQDFETCKAAVKQSRLMSLFISYVRVRSHPGVTFMCHPMSVHNFSVSSGTILKRSPTKPTSATWKIGASSSLLMAMMTLESFMPARCWIAPEMPTAI